METYYIVAISGNILEEGASVFGPFESTLEVRERFKEHLTEWWISDYEKSLGDPVERLINNEPIELLDGYGSSITFYIGLRRV